MGVKSMLWLEAPRLLLRRFCPHAEGRETYRQYTSTHTHTHTYTHTHTRTRTRTRARTHAYTHIPQAPSCGDKSCSASTCGMLWRPRPTFDTACTATSTCIPHSAGGPGHWHRDTTHFWAAADFPNSGSPPRGSAASLGHTRRSGSRNGGWCASARECRILCNCPRPLAPWDTAGAAPRARGNATFQCSSRAGRKWCRECRAAPAKSLFRSAGHSKTTNRQPTADDGDSRPLHGWARAVFRKLGLQDCLRRATPTCVSAWPGGTARPPLKIRSRQRSRGRCIVCALAGPALPAPAAAACAETSHRSHALQWRRASSPRRQPTLSTPGIRTLRNALPALSLSPVAKRGQSCALKRSEGLVKAQGQRTPDIWTCLWAPLQRHLSANTPHLRCDTRSAGTGEEQGGARGQCSTDSIGAHAPSNAGRFERASRTLHCHPRTGMRTGQGAGTFTRTCARGLPRETAVRFIHGPNAHACSGDARNMLHAFQSAPPSGGTCALRCALPWTPVQCACAQPKTNFRLVVKGVRVTCEA